MFRHAVRASLLLAFSMLAGCVSMPAMTYQPGIDNTERLLADRHPLDVGSFAAAPGVENRHLGMRGSQLQGGADGTFSTYLKDALVRELQEAGRFRAGGATVVSGTLVENRLNAASSAQGTARLGAEFVVTRRGERVYARTFHVENRWEASFMGAIAIPAAMQGYSATVQKLLGELFADPEFRRVVDEGSSVR